MNSKEMGNTTQNNPRGKSLDSKSPPQGKHQKLPFQAVLESGQFSFQSAMDKGQCHIGGKTPSWDVGTVGLPGKEVWASKT